MKKYIYILSLLFAVLVMSSCQKTELDDLEPLKVNSEERVDSESYTPPGKGGPDDGDVDDSDNGGEPEDGITDDDDEDDDDELEGRETEEAE
ncbi:hypothetical protein [Halocola ammonii]